MFSLLNHNPKKKIDTSVETHTHTHIHPMVVTIAKSLKILIF